MATLTEGMEFLYLKIEILEQVLLKCLNPNVFYKLKESANIRVEFDNVSDYLNLGKLKQIWRDVHEI